MSTTTDARTTGGAAGGTSRADTFPRLLESLVAERPDGIAIYKSTGSGFQDIVLAEQLYDRAVERGLGTPLPTGILTIRK